ncbi:hypothetical protein [Paenibacillus terrigena]|uniref:hypothetical protein n=1 Tax=Paenibacillus terrigena TaxID=369333 RepID=UPI001B7FA5B5|nr:hypothetical protein [Paenibacillus terrigena]
MTSEIDGGHHFLCHPSLIALHPLESYLDFEMVENGLTESLICNKTPFEGSIFISRSMYEVLSAELFDQIEDYFLLLRDEMEDECSNNIFGPEIIITLTSTKQEGAASKQAPYLSCSVS